MKLPLPYHISIIWLGILATLFFSFFPFIIRSDEQIYDVMMRRSLVSKKASENIILIAVDKSTLEHYGQKWGWSTGRYAGLLDTLIKQQPKAIVLDYFFSEKSRPDNMDWDLISRLEGKTEEDIYPIFDKYSDTIYKNPRYISSNDRDFAMLMKKGGNVFLPYIFSTDTEGVMQTDIERRPYSLYGNASHGGFVNVKYDPDGQITTVIPYIHDTDSLALSVAKYVRPEVKSDFPDGEDIRLNFFSLPYDRFDAIQFHRAYNEDFTTYEGKKVSLKDKIIIVGDYHESLGDTHKVPISDVGVMAGMEILANQIQMYLDDRVIQELSDFQKYTLLILLSFVSGIIFFLSRNFILNGIFLITSTTILFFVSDAFFRSDIYLPVFSLGLGFVMPFSAIHIHRSIRNFYEKESIKRIFSRHVDKNIVTKLMESKKAQEAEKRTITVLFCDIEGFTTFSETLPPDKLMKVLNRVFHVFNDVIFSCSWTINKYIWDAIMVFWGAPLEDGYHAQHACEAAILMKEHINILSKEFEKEGLPRIRARIGINTGEAIVGNVGDEHYADYTIIGDTVNIASRLEGINKYYSTSLLVTETTYESIRSSFLCRHIDTVQVKWKYAPTRLYEILSALGEMEAAYHETKIQAHHKALGYYQEWDWKRAQELFQENLEMGDKIAEIFLDRMKETNGIAPKNWDGIYRFQTK